jgi:hypothetical protein
MYLKKITRVKIGIPIFTRVFCWMIINADKIILLPDKQQVFFLTETCYKPL